MPCTSIPSLKWLTVLILLVCFLPGRAQNRAIDSLKIMLADSSNDRVKILIELAKENNMSGNYEAGLKFASQAVPLALANGDSLEIVMAYRYKGAGLRRMERFDEALEIITNANAIAQRNNFITELKFIFNSMAMIYFSKAQYDKALDFYFKTLVIREAQGDQSEVSITLNNIAVVYSSLENHKKALDFYNKSMDAKKMANDNYDLDRLLINIGLSEAHLDNFEMAAGHIKQAFDVCDDHCTDEIKIEGEYGLGLVDYHLHQLAESREHHAISYELARKSDNQRYQSENLISLGRIARESGDLREAENSLKTAEAIAVKVGYNQLLIDVYKELFKLYSLRRDGRKEGFYLKKYVSLNDSLISLDLVKNIAVIQSRFDERENLRNIKMLEENIVLKNEAIARQHLLNIVLSSAALLLVVVGILIYRLYALRNKSNKQLDDKVRQRTQQLEEGQTQMQAVLQEQSLFIENIHIEMKALAATLRGLSLLEKQGVEKETKVMTVAGVANRLEVIISRIEMKRGAAPELG